MLKNVKYLQGKDYFVGSTTFAELVDDATPDDMAHLINRGVIKGSQGKLAPSHLRVIPTQSRGRYFVRVSEIRKLQARLNKIKKKNSEAETKTTIFGILAMEGT